MNVRFLIGLYFLNISESNNALLIKGCNMALFTFLGIVPVDKDKFTNLVITGNKVSKHSFNNYVGIPSSSHDFDADLVIIFLISSGVASENSVRISSHSGSGTGVN